MAKTRLLNRDTFEMRTGLVEDGGVRYLLGAEGTPLSGWQQWSGLWYYANRNGSLHVGWLHDGSSWYNLEL